MSKTPVRLILLTTVASSLAATRVTAQLGYGVDAVWNSRYEWRGLTLRDGMVLQPDAYVSVGGRSTLTTGVWTNVELTTPVSGEDVGFGRTLFGETNVWVEAATVAGPADLAFGWNWFLFDSRLGNHVPIGPFNTHELYGRVQFSTLPIVVPVVRYFHDIDEVQGGYLEGELSFRVPFWTQVEVPIGSIWITALGGYNLSQDNAGPVTRFQDHGLTHLELTTSTTTGYTPVSLFGLIHANISFHVAFHIQWNLDDATKLVGSSSRLRDTWLALGVSWSGPRCEPTRTIC